MMHEERPTEEAEEVSTNAAEEETAADVAWGSMAAVAEEPAEEPVAAATEAGEEESVEEPVAVAMEAVEEQPADETEASSDKTSVRAWLADAFGFL